ncbi:DUF1080 domain-containing protein [Plantibacter flavus]|uniref:family 16 glycoside hydrolase n=1 Tax=Plantibacter flavus TaxID=150123 RepID=UPI003F1663FF
MNGPDTTHAIDIVSDSQLELRSVVAAPDASAGRSCVRVRLDPQVEAHGVPGVDYVDQPTFAILPDITTDAVIEVEILSRLRPDAPEYARGFAGIAFRISDDAERFEAVYLRPTNGIRTGVDEPRRSRGLQYFAYPDWPFDRLRTERPDGGYESAADIAPDEWIRLRIEVRGRHITARVNDDEVVEFGTGLAEPRPGRIGFWVDIGTDAVFSKLRVTPLDD